MKPYLAGRPLTLPLLLGLLTIFGAGCIANRRATAELPTPLPPVEVTPEVTPAVQACTKIGCQDVLIVQLKGNVPKEYLVEVTAPDGTTHQIQCADGQASVSGNGQCLPAQEVAFANFTPEEVLVSVTWDGGLLVQDLRPAYSAHRPNGPNCEPECQKGIVEFYIP